VRYSKELPLELAGPSLRLRPLRLADAPRVLQLLRDPEVSRYFLWEPPRTLEQARDYVSGFQADTEHQWAYHFAIVPRRTVPLLGVANLYHINPGAREGEIGLWLGRAYWGQGVQQEVSGLLIEFGFRTLCLKRLLFRVAEGNSRAHAAFRKLGVAERGRVWLFSRRHEAMVEHRVYALDGADWPAGAS
jgi:ribosomal-protein-alanine N-acetyltransferase